MVGRFLFTTIVLVFLLGFLAGTIFTTGRFTTEQPLAALLGSSAERTGPGDHVPEDSIKVYSDRVILYLDDPFWASFTDTNSMDPVLDVGANSIEVKPRSPDDVRVGDVISFTTSRAAGTIIHRIVEKGKDKEGIYFITKGDNNPSRDPGRVRFEDIHGVVVAIVY